MSAYDDMRVCANSSLVAHVCSRNVATSSYKSKSLLRKSIGWLRVCLLLLLVVSPATTSPVIRSRRASLLRAAAAAAGVTTAEVQEEILRAVHPQSSHRTHSGHRLANTASRTSSKGSHSSSSSSSSYSSYSSTSHIRMEDQPDDVSRSRRSTAHWSQPCMNLMHDASNTQQTLSDEILLAVAKANSYMGSFKTNFSREVLQLEWNDLVDHHTKDFHLDFIKVIDNTNANMQDFDEQLQIAYEVMQRLAVGIEQVTLDQALYQGTFLQQFRMIESHIVSILCQLHYAMVHRKLAPSVAVTKEIMKEDYRDLEGEAARNMRDAVIMREYNDALVHLRDVFTVLEKAPASSEAPADQP